MTLYDIKPKFQALLRPLVKRLAEKGVTANQVTIAAAVGSVLLGILLYTLEIRLLFILLPIWMFIRMALNAIDGMLAREFNQKSKLGEYLNELCDVISDAALFLPFIIIAAFTTMPVLLVILLAIVSEFTGVIGVGIGASRRYDGPMGKSDRAFLFSILAIWVAFTTALPSWSYWIMPIITILLCVTIFNRVRRALEEVKTSSS
ncbi:CDP-diacylglycerol--glycerol-3-phosphate 3-phosphatidyltransferase [hydrothermal vent metagenome]|uniref:CDP-diacylglycerol--glycerol-3-phosphate 3-phosphatidyltransferase n=1 Tax=hydrothermal vent metagenome TaxID=652676 RepID=A0A3B0Y0T5_9ZZZZ